MRIGIVYAPCSGERLERLLMVGPEVCHVDARGGTLACNFDVE